MFFNLSQSTTFRRLIRSTRSTNRISPRSATSRSRNNSGRLSAAGELYDKDSDTFFDVLLPYGAKPRLIMYYLNKQSIIQKSNILEVEPTPGQLVKKLGFESNGRDYKTIQDQFGRLEVTPSVGCRALYDSGWIRFQHSKLVIN